MTVLAIVGFIASGAKSAASWALGLAKAHPWPLACLVLSIASVSLWSGKSEAIAQRDAIRASLRAEKDGRRSDRADWRRQVATAKAAKEAAERKSKEVATHAQTSHDALAADNAGLRSYIAANRLRAGSYPAAATVTTDDHGATVPDAAAADTFVATSEADIVTCDALYVYSTSAHEWAQEMIFGKSSASSE